MKGTDMRLTILFSMVVFTGCATVKWYNMNPAWNPPHGYDWAVAKCQSEGSLIRSQNAMQDGFDKARAYDACMKTYGFERAKITELADPQKIMS